MNFPSEPRSKRRHRVLSREEIELWREVTRSIAQLRAPAKRAVEPPESPGSSREPTEKPVLDHDDFGSNRSKVMNVIDSKSLERDAGEKPVPTFSHPALARPALPGYTPPPQRPTTGAQALHPLDRRARKKLARGHMALDSVLDLHGMRQDEAHSALRSFLLATQSADARMVLVITGKGLRGGASWPERGVLYRSVPHWLAAADLRRIVAGFEEADAAHGGAGALYVRLRRKEKAGPAPR